MPAIQIHKMEVITVDLTPSDLRAIADELEKKWATVKLGQEVPRKILVDNGIQVVLRIDQTRMTEKNANAPE